MFAVDTNVLIHAVHNGVAEQPPCRALLERCRADRIPWFLTWSIVYEFLRVSTHPRVFGHPLTIEQAWSFVDSLRASPSLSILVETERHGDVAGRTFEELGDLSGNLLHDAHTAILMREHGISRIYTLDNDFHRFPFLEVLDPLASAPSGRTG